MKNNMQIYKNIQISKKNGAYVSHQNSSILLTGNYLIIITKDLRGLNNMNYEEHIIYNLDEITSYILK